MNFHGPTAQPQTRLKPCPGTMPYQPTRENRYRLRSPASCKYPSLMNPAVLAEGALVGGALPLGEGMEEGEPVLRRGVRASVGPAEGRVYAGGTLQLSHGGLESLATPFASKRDGGKRALIGAGDPAQGWTRRQSGPARRVLCVFPCVCRGRVSGWQGLGGAGSGRWR